MGYKVMGIDINEETLYTTRKSGALHTFNSRSDKTLVDQIKELTNGGCHACAVFAAMKAGYDTSTKVLRVGRNLVPFRIAKEGIQISAFNITMKQFYINAANNHAQPADLTACAEFTAKHKISSPSRYFKLDQINEMIETMQQKKMAGYRLIVKFDESLETDKILNGNGAWSFKVEAISKLTASWSFLQR